MSPRALTAWPLLLLALWARPSRAEQSPGQLQGTFLQMWSHHRTWDEAEWQALFACLTALDLHELVVQFSQVDDLSLLIPSKDPPHPAPLETVLRLASLHGLRVWVGLHADLAYFDHIQKPPRGLESYLASLRVRSLALARQLAKKHPRFFGWYLSEEIHDESFLDPRRRQRLFTHLARQSRDLHRLAPDKKIGISGFSNGTLAVEKVGDFWRALVSATAIDTVFFQDGIGARKLDFDNLPAVLGSLRASIEAQGRQLRVVVETFRETPSRQARFTAQPAAWIDLRQQLVIARSVAGSGIMAFSVPEYMCPQSGVRARALFDDYRAAMGLAK